MNTQQLFHFEHVSPKQRLIAAGILLLVILSVVTVVVQRQARLATFEQNSSLLRKDLPGLQSSEVASFISAKGALTLASDTAKLWKNDVIFLGIESSGYTFEGKSKYWDAVYVSPSLQKTDRIRIAREGVVQQYEGIGVDTTVLASSSETGLAIDSASVYEVVLNDTRVKEYVVRSAGQVNPSFYLYNKSAIEDKEFASSLKSSDLLWKITMNFVKGNGKSQEVWVDARSGVILTIKDVTATTTKTNK